MEPIFHSNDFLWEPVRSLDAAATVKNVGSLWLKCTISFANVQTTGESDITKVLNVHKLPVGAASVEEGEYLGTMNELMADGKFIVGDGEGILALQDVAGDGYPATDSFILVIKMQEKAGNEYQDCGVSFDVFVNATQYTHEEDGFGNDQYDKDAVSRYRRYRLGRKFYDYVSKIWNRTDRR